jgi:hypothetical protein
LTILLHNHFSGRVSRLITLVSFQLYESSGNQKFLDAAHQAALQYTQFVWFSPEIPDKDILVNKGGEAPLYWYFKGKGHLQMAAAEEICSSLASLVDWSYP